MENPDTQTTLRDQISAAFDTPTETVAEPATPVVIHSAEASDKARDESGKFVPKAKAETPAAEQTQAEPKRISRPSSWKKDHWEAFDKVATENPSLAEYINQREKEFASGVATYKTEAQQAKELTEALAPFMPELQQHGIKPKDWISNLGNAHRMLALGSPEQKVQMFRKLAADYGVNLGGQQQLEVNPLAQKLQSVEQRLNQYLTQQQQAEQAAIASEIEKFSSDTEQYPHFERVRATMGQLLESGMASDLKSAYTKAIRMDDDVFQEMTAQQQLSEKQKQTAIAKEAKSKALSVKTSSPKGVVKDTGAKDRRSALEAAFDQVSPGRL